MTIHLSNIEQIIFTAIVIYVMKKNNITKYANNIKMASDYLIKNNFDSLLNMLNNYKNDVLHLCLNNW